MFHGYNICTLLNEPSGTNQHFIPATKLITYVRHTAVQTYELRAKYVNLHVTGTNT